MTRPPSEPRAAPAAQGLSEQRPICAARAQWSCRRAWGRLAPRGAEPLARLGDVVLGHHGSDHTSFLADDSSSESCSGNGSSTLNPSTSSSTQGDSTFPEMNGNGTAAPMDFTASADDQPINLCDKLAPAHVTPSYQSDSCSADGLRSRVKYAVKTTAEVWPRLQVATARAGAGRDRAATHPRTELVQGMAHWEQAHVRCPRPGRDAAPALVPGKHGGVAGLGAFPL